MVLINFLYKTTTTESDASRSHKNNNKMTIQETTHTISSHDKINAFKKHLWSIVKNNESTKPQRKAALKKLAELDKK